MCMPSSQLWCLDCVQHVFFCYSSDKKGLQIQRLINYSSGHQRESVYLCQSIALRYDIVLLLKTHPRSPGTDWDGNKPTSSFGKTQHTWADWILLTELLQSSACLRLQMFRLTFYNRHCDFKNIYFPQVQSILKSHPHPLASFNSFCLKTW